jgi:methylthioribose-1-phosphate isomerase
VLTAIRWDGVLHLLDQRRLPDEERWISLGDPGAVASAIRDMVVRGAPAIGIAAGYGLALAQRNGVDPVAAGAMLASARPTAVNLRWALDRLLRAGGDLEAAAIALHAEDLRINRALGEHGAALLSGGVLTICNTGALATGGHGTALGMVRSAIARGRSIHLYACETRPWLQGARLTTWECAQDAIPCTLVADGAAASVIASGRASAVVVGCDRVAVNGDTANKLGTLNLAIIAQHFGVPFYVAMPLSSFDRATPNGTHIVVEERDPREVLPVDRPPWAGSSVGAWNPAFDITPAPLITAWVSEAGVHRGRPDAGYSPVTAGSQAPVAQKH